MSQKTPQSMQGIENEDKPTTCPECGSTDIVLEDSEMICKACGLVLSE